MRFQTRYDLLLKHTKISLITAVLSLAIGGCTQFSSSENLIQAKSISQYETDKSFSNISNVLWTNENWWKVYGDVQLDTLIEEALNNSPNMTMAIARLHKADAFTQIANASLMPQVNADAQLSQQKQSYNYLTPKSMTPIGWNDYGQVNLNFSWEIDFWGKNRAAIAAAVSEVEASNAELAQTRLTLSSAIATNYCELARLFDDEEKLKNSLAIQTKLLELLTKRLNNGLENNSAVSEAKSLQARIDGEILVVQEQISLQRNKLAALLGAGPDRGLSISRPFININKTNFGLPENLATDLLGRRPDIIAARLQVEAQLKRIEQKKAEFYPNVNLSAFIGVQSLGINMLDNKGSYNGSVGPAISLPIFTAGRLEGELRSTVSNYEETVANYNRAVTQALNEVADAGQSQKALTNQLLKCKEELSNATEVYTIKTKRYEGGVGNYLDVLTAQKNLINIERNLINLKSRAFTLDIALKHALGGGYNQTTIIAKGN